MASLKSITDRLKRLEVTLNSIERELKQQRPNSGGTQHFGVPEAAHLLGKSEASIYRLAAKGQLPHSKIGNKLYFVKADLLQLFSQKTRKRYIRRRDNSIATEYLKQKRAENKRSVSEKKTASVFPETEDG